MSEMQMGGLKIERDLPLANFSSWIVGGTADFVAFPKSIEDVEHALLWAHQKGLAVTTFGGGTNVLISDKGIRGLTIILKYLIGVTSEVRVDASTQQERLTIECLAGTGKSELLKTFLKYRLQPALFLAGLPGEVGGGVAMNAGVGEAIRPREFVEITDWIEIVEPIKGLPEGEFKLQRRILQKSELQWSYRHCSGWQPGIIVRCGLSWPNFENSEVIAEVRRANQVRLSKQPLELPSCGSVFTNPPGHKAGQIIEAAGLKGFTIGGAKVSEKHANFIVNFAQAKAQDIHQIIIAVQNKVRETSGVELCTEVVYLGDW